MTAADPTSKWLDDMALELRVRNVDGADIGDAMASVREHLADTDNDPWSEFGTPVEYARSLELPNAGNPVTPGLIFRTALGLLSFFGFNLAASPWVHAQGLDVTLAQVLLLAVPVALIIVLIAFLGALVRRMWLLWILMAVAVASGAFSAMFSPASPADVWLTVAPLPVVIVTSAAMFGCSIAGTKSVLADGPQAIHDPLADRGDRARRDRRDRASGIASQWIFPVAAVVFLAAAALTS